MKQSVDWRNGQIRVYARKSHVLYSSFTIADRKTRRIAWKTRIYIYVKLILFVKPFQFWLGKLNESWYLSITCNIDDLSDSRDWSNVPDWFPILYYLVVDLDSKPESVALQLVLVVQRLNDLQRSGAVVVSHHREFVRSVSAVFDHLDGTWSCD